MILMTREQWNSRLSGGNYDQAWSMVHFLVHADDGKYQKGFARFINDVAAGRPWRLAFIRRFGKDVDAFQLRYGEWWTSLPDNPTEEKYILSTVQTLTSFLGRSFAKGQKFDSAEAFFDSAREGKLKMNPEQWLPPELLKEALSRSAAPVRWSLNTERSRPRLLGTLSDGTVFTGTFVLRGTSVEKVEVSITSPPAGEAPSAKAPGR